MILSSETREEDGSLLKTQKLYHFQHSCKVNKVMATQVILSMRLQRKLHNNTIMSVLAKSKQTQQEWVQSEPCKSLTHKVYLPLKKVPNHHLHHEWQ
jgi:CRISPR/Cas system type I-B associated protein Csh2 (Cas7 group RAMP superfamily)